MEFRILGPLEVHAEGRELSLGRAKQRALLAVLLLHANEVVSMDRLVDELWGDRPPATAFKAVQVYVSQLRKALRGPRGRDEADAILVTRAPGYVLRVGPGELDGDRFEKLVDEGRRALAAGSPRLAANKLLEGLALWRGPALADFALESFARSEIARLEEARVSALEERIEADLVLGRHAELIGELEALVREHSLRQRLRSQLILSLYRSGRDAEALEAYQEARRLLVEELGIEPRRELRDLQQAILRQDPSLDVVADMAAAESARGVFVGRERELEQLSMGLDEAFAGRGGLFLLVGEPGIGKSRLANELSRRARAQGACVLVGRCWEVGGAPAYWPWLQALRAYTRETEAEALRSQLGAGAPDLAQLLPELHELYPDLPKQAELEQESARFRLFEATAFFLKRAAEHRPLVLVLDDVHAADEPSLLLLQFIARELPSSHILIVGAYRDIDPAPSDALRATVTELVREPVTTRVLLTGLPQPDVARFIELCAEEAATPEVVSAIHDSTQGNPLFVGEMVRLLAAEGSLADATRQQLVVPQSVRDVITRRLRHLSAECNHVLVVASVLGREFAVDALARAVDLGEEQLLDTLEEAMMAGVVTDAPGNPRRLRFAHVLIRDTLYDGLTFAGRVRLHRLATGALELLYGDRTGSHLAELAHHAIAGSDFEKGLRYARRAADRALALLAYEEAARLYGVALDALALSPQGAEEAARCDLLLSLGEADSRAGNGDSAKTAFLEAAAIARRLGRSRELARAAAGYGGRLLPRAGDDPHLVPLLEDALLALGGNDDQLRVRLLACLTTALRDEPTRARRDTLSEEAVILARRSGNPIALARSLDARIFAIIAPDTIGECLGLALELCEVATRIGDEERIVQAHMDALSTHLILGNVEQATAALATATASAQRLQQPAQLFQARSAAAMLALAAGRLAEAEDLTENAFAVGSRAIPAASACHAFQRYMLAELLGSVENAEQALQQAANRYPARPVFRCALIHLHAQTGRSEDARRGLGDLARDEFSVVPLDMEWLLAMSLLAETAAHLRDTESASVLYRLLEPYARLNVADTAEGMRGSVARYLGLLAAMLERWDRAPRHFEEALAMNEHMGAHPWLAHTQADYGRTLIARGETALASELLATAVATYRQLGMEHHAVKESALANKFSTIA